MPAAWVEAREADATRPGRVLRRLAAAVDAVLKDAVAGLFDEGPLRSTQVRLLEDTSHAGKSVQLLKAC